MSIDFEALRTRLMEADLLIDSVLDVVQEVKSDVMVKAEKLLDLVDPPLAAPVEEVDNTIRIGDRVKVTCPGHLYEGQYATITAINDNVYKGPVESTSVYKGAVEGTSETLYAFKQYIVKVENEPVKDMEYYLNAIREHFKNDWRGEGWNNYNPIPDDLAYLKSVYDRFVKGPVE